MHPARLAPRTTYVAAEILSRESFFRDIANEYEDFLSLRNLIPLPC